MSGPQPEPPADAQAPFDPFRRRKEIELLERRFREKLAKTSNPADSTGEIERKVSEEMREFFSASEAHLLQVVPSLEGGAHGSLQETTGEMRARVDEFFSEVNSDPPRPRTTPNAVPAKEARAPRAIAPVEMVVETDAETDAPAAPKPDAKSAAKPDRGAAGPARPGSASRTPKSRTGIPSRGAPSVPGAGPARKTSSSESGASSKPKLDLKTALERLRKHGGGRGAPVVNFAAAAQPEPAAAPESSPASPPASASASSAVDASAAAPAAPVAPTRPAPSRETGSQDATSSQDLRSPGSSSPLASSPGTSPAVAPSTGAASSDEADPAARTPSGPVLSPLAQLQAAKSAAERAAAEKALADKAEADKAEADKAEAEQPSASPATAEKPSAEKKPAEKTPAEKTPSPSRASGAALLSNVPVAEPMPPAAVANALAGQEIRWQKEEQTHSILPPLQREPRTGPIAGVPTFERRKEQTTSGRERSHRSGSDRSRADTARPPLADTGRAQLPPIGWGGSAPETSRKPQTGGGTSPPTTGATTGAVRLGRARSLSTIDDVSTAMAPRAPNRGETFDEIFDELQGLVLETLKESVDETMHEAKKSEGQLRPREAAPSASSAARTGPAAAPVKPLRLAKPSDDDEDEDAHESREQAPAEPYKWGVQPSPRPAGAWLVGDEAPAATAGKPAKPANPAQAAQPSEPAAAPAPAPAPAPAKDAREISAGAGLGVGGRAYLIKKAADEVKRIQPVMDSLVKKGVVKPEEFADPAAPAPRKGSDDELSVDSFADRPRVDLEKELSPVRLVEELRRIRRLTDALLAKGVVTQDDLNRIAE